MTTINVLLLLPFLLGMVQSKQQMKDCVRPWQSPLMGVATVLQPSRPLECQPDAPSACSRGRNSVCQFSLRYYKYICCQDSSDQPPPLCPAQHDSLQLVCGSGANHDTACPKSYKCLPSRTNHELRLCCRPNSNTTHPEPDTTFRENRLVPQVLPQSPKNQLDVIFENTTLILGQLLDSKNLGLLENAPVLSSALFQEDKQYVIVLVDSTTKQLVWLAGGMSPTEDKLAVVKNTKTNLMYIGPASDAEGVHVMILVVYEQTGKWKSPKVAQDEFSFDEFEKQNPVQSPPLTGTFYAYTTKEDERF